MYRNNFILSCRVATEPKVYSDGNKGSVIVFGVAVRRSEKNGDRYEKIEDNYTIYYPCYSDKFVSYLTMDRDLIITGYIEMAPRKMSDGSTRRAIKFTAETVALGYQPKANKLDEPPIEDYNVEF